MEGGFMMKFFRKLLTLPFNLICVALAPIGVLFIRTRYFALAMEKRLDVFEEVRKKNKHNRKRNK